MVEPNDDDFLVATIMVIVLVVVLFRLLPTLGVGLLDFKLNSSPRPELFSSPSLLLAHPWSAQPQSVPGVLI